jgi:hypothetical protein
MRPEEHSDAPQENVNFDITPLFGFSPRSTQLRAQPPTHSIAVSPPGALTINSKSGFDVCARPAAHPASNATTTATATVHVEWFITGFLRVSQRPNLQVLKSTSSVAE